MKIIEAENTFGSGIELKTDNGLTISFDSGFGASDRIKAQISDDGSEAYFVGTNYNLYYTSLLIVDINHLEYLKHTKPCDYIETDVFIEGESLEQYETADTTFFDLDIKEQVDILIDYMS